VYIGGYWEWSSFLKRSEAFWSVLERSGEVGKRIGFASQCAPNKSCPEQLGRRVGRAAQCALVTLAVVGEESQQLGSQMCLPLYSQEALCRAAGQKE